MSAPIHLHRYSFKDYLAIEEISTVKHEYLDGDIFAMAGGSVLHAALSAAVSAALHARLPDGCRVYSSDLRIRILATGLATYPDVTVVCGPLETAPESDDTVTNPAVLVEVLSPGTMEYDLGKKFESYRQIPSLKAVVYLWQDRRQIEVRERGDGGAWKPGRIVTSNQSVEVEALGCVLTVDALYLDAGASELR